MRIRSKAGSSVAATIDAKGMFNQRTKIKGRWEIECRDKYGILKWKEVIENLVVNDGLNYLLEAGLAAGTQITSWFVGLTASSPTPAAADLMNSHGGWTENVTYSQANRVAFTAGAVASQSVSNSAAKAAFSINGTTTVGGAFLTSVNTKSGTTGRLFSVGAFTGGNRSLIDGDTLNVQATFTQADDGV